MDTHSVAAVSILCAGLTVAGCGRVSSTNLRPNALPPGHGAVFGRVQVFKGTKEVTGSCSVSFTDENNQEKGARSLDDSGWVFTSLPEGTTYLSFVQCAVWNGLMYGTRALDFAVAAPGRATYFGHVRFALPDEDGKKTLDALALGVAGVPVTSALGAAVVSTTTGAGTLSAALMPTGTNEVTVDDRSAEALAEYRARYGVEPAVYASLVGVAPQRQPDPELSSTVVRHGDTMASQARLSDVKLTWLASLTQPGLTLRLDRYVSKPELESCHEIVIGVDGESHSAPLEHSSKRVATAFEESVQAGIDLATLHAIAAAKTVLFRACGLQRKLSPQGAEAAANLAAAYESLVMADQPQQSPASGGEQPSL